MIWLLTLGLLCWSVAGFVWFRRWVAGEARGSVLAAIAISGPFVWITVLFIVAAEAVSKLWAAWP